MKPKQYTRNEIKEMSRNRLQERYNSLYIENKELKEKLKCKSLCELGFKKTKSTNGLNEVVYEKETRQWRENGKLQITIDNEKTVDIGFNEHLPVFLNLDELKAIVYELELLEE